MTSLIGRIWKRLGAPEKPEREPKFDQTEVLRLGEPINEYGIKVEAGDYIVVVADSKKYILSPQDGVSNIELPVPYVERLFEPTGGTSFDVIKEHERGGSEGTRTLIDLGIE